MCDCEQNMVLKWFSGLDNVFQCDWYRSALNTVRVDHSVCRKSWNETTEVQFFDVNTVPSRVSPVCLNKLVHIYPGFTLPVSVWFCLTVFGFDLQCGSIGEVGRESSAICGLTPRPCSRVKGHGGALVIVCRRGARARAYITKTAAAAWPLACPPRPRGLRMRQCSISEEWSVIRRT